MNEVGNVVTVTLHGERCACENKVDGKRGRMQGGNIVNQKKERERARAQDRVQSLVAISLLYFSTSSSSMPRYLS